MWLIHRFDCQVLNSQTTWFCKVLSAVKSHILKHRTNVLVSPNRKYVLLKYFHLLFSYYSTRKKNLTWANLRGLMHVPKVDEAGKELLMWPSTWCRRHSVMDKYITNGVILSITTCIAHQSYYYEILDILSGLKIDQKWCFNRKRNMIQLFSQSHYPQSLLEPVNAFNHYWNGQNPRGINTYHKYDPFSWLISDSSLWNST